MTVLRGLTLARAAVLAALPFGAACTDSSRCTDMGFARLREADRAVVTIDSRSVGNALRSPQVLQSMSQFAKDHASGWSLPGTARPSPGSGWIFLPATASSATWAWGPTS